MPVGNDRCAKCEMVMVRRRAIFSLTRLRVAGFLFSLGMGAFSCQGQDLAPRAYLITPIHSNAVVLTYSYFNGSILFDPTVPITDAKSQINVSALSLFHTLNFFGRSASLTATLPYGVGNFQGLVTGAPTEGKLYRSGLLDSTFRFSVNLKGGPAMSVREFPKWRQKTLLGVSFTMVAPTGQYDPTRLLNQGANRWAFKPELGWSRRWGKWVVDAYGAAWFFTANNDFFSRNAFSPGTNTKTQAPIAALETHLSRDFKPRLWVSLDGNFWHGGQTSINGVEQTLTVQSNSRVGVTGSVPVGKHQSLKFSYNRGAYVRIGGDYQNVSFGWQCTWLGRPN
jgi:hypothetical protein